MNMGFRFTLYTTGIIYEAFDHTADKYMLQYYIEKKPHFQTHNKRSLHEYVKEGKYKVVEGEVKI
jgi:hypothetical protein